MYEPNTHSLNSPWMDVDSSLNKLTSIHIVVAFFRHSNTKDGKEKHNFPESEIGTLAGAKQSLVSPTTWNM